MDGLESLREGGKRRFDGHTLQRAGPDEAQHIRVLHDALHIFRRVDGASVGQRDRPPPRFLDCPDNRLAPLDGILPADHGLARLYSPRRLFQHAQ